MTPAQYRTLRISLSLSQINLAKALGVSRDTIIRLERGQSVKNEQAFALLYLKLQHDTKDETQDT